MAIGIRPKDLPTSTDVAVIPDLSGVVFIEKDDVVFKIDLQELIDYVTNSRYNDISAINAINGSLVTIDTNIDNADTTLQSKEDTLHTHTKDQVGLSNVENLTPPNMPISNATQLALDLKHNGPNLDTIPSATLIHFGNTAQW